MDVDQRLAAVAAAISNEARTRMLCALLDGRSRTAAELAAIAAIAASTASAHLARLEDAKLIECLRSGRHRCCRLAGAAAAEALESLLRLSACQDEPRPFRPTTPPGLQFARTCYDHTAGELAVLLRDRVLAAGWLTFDGNGYTASPSGRIHFRKLAVDLDAYPVRRRFAYPCLDWSERRFHVGGWGGAALLLALERKHWLIPDPGSRALDLTASDKRGLASTGIRV